MKYWPEIPDTGPAWFAEHGGEPGQSLFATRAGRALSRDTVERLVAKHASTAAATCPAIAGKNVTPHVLRHSAMALQVALRPRG
jgi:integrase/recombinase XerD